MCILQHAIIRKHLYDRETILSKICGILGNTILNSHNFTTVVFSHSSSFVNLRPGNRRTPGRRFTNDKEWCFRFSDVRKYRGNFCFHKPRSIHGLHEPRVAQLPNASAPPPPRHNNTFASTHTKQNRRNGQQSSSTPPMHRMSWRFRVL